jgi:hypothetical protein
LYEEDLMNIGFQKDIADKEQECNESFMEKHKLRGSCRKREGCWLKRIKLRVQCKGEHIHFPLMSKGESKEKRET